MNELVPGGFADGMREKKGDGVMVSDYELSISMYRGRPWCLRQKNIVAFSQHC